MQDRRHPLIPRPLFPRPLFPWALVPWALGAAVLSLPGCATKTLGPPPVSLEPYPVIGVVELSTNGTDGLDAYATQELIRHVQSAQPGTAVLKLGPERDLLDSLGKTRMDADALRSIGSAHGVDAVLGGRLELSTAIPRAASPGTHDPSRVALVPPDGPSASTRGRLTAYLRETRVGATVWSEAVQAETSPADLEVAPSEEARFGATGGQAAQGKLVRLLTVRITTDLRPAYR